MTIFLFIIIAFLALFSILLIMLIFGWASISKYFLNAYKSDVYVSIIVVVRNEEKNIEKLIQSIDKQFYSKNLFELIVVNDQSTDGTLISLENFKNKVDFNFEIIDLMESVNLKATKKFAISAAIKIAKGQMIITTDGDCQVGPNWIESFVNYYQKTGKKVISGPVTFNSDTFFGDWQIIEFASLIGTGAASIQLNMPNMCNGANLCYEKEAFLAVNGFEGYEQFPSGDDEFLMHKINRKYENSIGFLKSAEALVYTHPQPDISAFLMQRKRWASKWDKYLDIKNTILAIFVFGVNLCSIFTLILIVSGNSTLYLNLVFALKIILEWVFISLILRFLNNKSKIFLIPIVQLTYPFYVVYTALNSSSKNYVWKGRVY